MRLRVYSTCQFAMPFQIGNSGQYFNLSLSLMFSDTILSLEEQLDYIPLSKADPQTYQRIIFDPKASSTFYNYSEEFSNQIYGEGYFAADNMDFQSTKNKGSRMDFMLLTYASLTMVMTLSYLPADGFLGLAPTDTTGFGMDTFVDWLMKKQGTKSTKMTFFLEKFNPYDSDEMAQNSFAMVDFSGNSLPEYCQEEKWFLNDRPKIPIPYYLMVAKTVSFQQKNANIPTIIGQNETLIVGATMFFTLIPEKKMSVMADIIGAKIDVDGLYYLPCNATKNAPTLKFEFANSQSEEMVVEFAPEEYILPKNDDNDDDDGCILIFTPLPAKFGDAYFLGYSFFQGRHCFRLNYDGNVGQVGLAPIKKPHN